MAIDWLWTTQSKADVAPAIGDQHVMTGNNVLCLRNPWPADSAFMGKLFFNSHCSMDYLLPIFLME
ncbi:hypothetical protein [Zestomonas carbonaria]|uniref:hypothetical protein n=1 Tax=Zestomonas carbonaria TaxID=2762745 RepID=UPI0016574AE4|nr:hypothetical protein [Pseudomonas carbonaria]